MSSAEWRRGSNPIVNEHMVEEQVQNVVSQNLFLSSFPVTTRSLNVFVVYFPSKMSQKTSFTVCFTYHAILKDYYDT